MSFKPEVVTKRARDIFLVTWQSQANLTLFLGLQVLIAFVLPSMGFGKEDTQRYSDIGFSVLLISGVAIAWGRRWLFFMSGAVAVVALALRWLARWSTSPRLSLDSDWWTLIAMLAIAFVLLAQIFRDGPVTHARIQGAVAVYLLFGLAWAHAFHITNILHPGSFNVPSGELSSVNDWVYYSYVTLSTVGYGDITPVHTIARTLATSEALTGQLYLAVLVARLVAMEIISWQQKAMQDSKD